MLSKEIKKSVKLKEMAKFYGLSHNTIGNYLKELKKQEKQDTLPLIGRHNIIKALTTYYMQEKQSPK